MFLQHERVLIYPYLYSRPLFSERLTRRELVPTGTLKAVELSRRQARIACHVRYPARIYRNTVTKRSREAALHTYPVSGTKNKGEYKTNGADSVEVADKTQ